MKSLPLIDALSRLEQRLFEMPVLEAFIARREAGEDDTRDAETADALVCELLHHQSPDGSWGGRLINTAEALLLMAELRPFTQDVRDQVDKALAWLRTRQHVPGAFTDGCTPERHAYGLCHHWACGFFSPGPPTVSLAGASLSSGATFPTDEDARLGQSALALRALLGYQHPSLDDALHIEALLRIADLLFREAANVATPTAITVLAALARAPRTPHLVAVLHKALTRLAGVQRADGSWPGAELFHVAEAFLIAEQSGFGSPVFDKAILRTAELLTLSQQPDGSWGPATTPQRLLIAWRTYRYAARLPVSSSQAT